MELKEKDGDKPFDVMDTLEQTIYYSVYVPADSQPDVDPYRNIFKNKHEALCLAKNFKKARFKPFLYYHEAVDFAMTGQTLPESTQDTVNNHKDSTVGEKPVAFRGLKSQDLVKLRKGIESGSLTFVETAVWDNPRYLISNGDTPSILQEGSRYNALHVAAKCKNRNMCELILNTVSNVNFITLLYGDDDNQDLLERSKILLDLYLNTPDKGLNETPLHFAVKFGAADVVELLVSYPQCDKNVRNKFGNLPNQIICERCDSVSPKVKSQIEMLLQDTFYVPVLRSEYNCAPPMIGEPFAPSSPPVFNEDPLQPRIEIHAYAGPMSKEAANKFRRIWKTPPRSLKQQHCKDLDKGLENVGRNLAIKHEVGWKEYWAFLDDFVDITSLDGLQQLEKYLSARVLIQYSDDSCTNTNSSIGSNNVLSPISDLCKDFEACRLSGSNPCDKQSHLGKTKTGDNRTACNIASYQLLNSEVEPVVFIEKVCEVFAHRFSNDILNLLESNYNKTIQELLQIDITQLETVLISFMTDNRFNKIDYRFVHYRVACGIVKRLRESVILEDEVDFLKRTLENWLLKCDKECDYFSSDDEYGNYKRDVLNHNNRMHMSKNKQIVCLLQHILNKLVVENSENDFNTVQTWTDGKSCDCTWPKSLHNKRNVNKLHSRSFGANQEDNVSRRLFTNDIEIDSLDTDNGCDILSKRIKLSSQCSESEDSDSDTFESAINHPMDGEDSDNEDMFEDSIMPEEDVFIEGSIPTKMDYAVYNAISCVKERLNPEDYPNIYKWYHAINSYPENERRNWGSSSTGRCRINSQTFSTSTPTHSNISCTTMNRQSPSSPWLRRIGLASSPQSQRSIKVSKNISFNL